MGNKGTEMCYIKCLGDPLEKKAVSREVKNEIRKAKIKLNQYNSGDLKAA